jgi:ferrous iron transport protein A
VTEANSTEKRIKLGELTKGTKALISQVGIGQNSHEMVSRLMEMGVLEGSFVEVVHEAPFGGDPVAIRVRGALIALRRQEANAVEVIIYE